MRAAGFKAFWSILCLLFLSGSAAVADNPLKYSSLQEIRARENKLELKRLRVWGGDEETDEHKFFKSPNGRPLILKTGSWSMIPKERS